MFKNIPSKADIESIYSMRNGDDTVSYTQTGEMVIPRSVQAANPALVAAAQQTFQSLGMNPNRYVVGHPDGQINPRTGAQEFYDFSDLMEDLQTVYEEAKEYRVDKLAEMATDTLDYVSNSDIAQSATVGLVSAGAAKLKGADTKTALATGAGTAAGYYAGDAIGDWASSTPPATTQVQSTSVKDAVGNAANSFSKAGLAGAGIGAKLAYNASKPKPEPMDMPDPIEAEDPNLPPQTIKPSMPSIPQNQQPNVSATLPEDLPIAPLVAPTTPSDVSYKKKVKNRETGEYEYVDLEGNDAAAFSRSVRRMGRRKNMLGDKILIG